MDARRGTRGVGAAIYPRSSEGATDHREIADEQVGYFWGRTPLP